MCITEKNSTLSGLLILPEEKPNGSHPSLRKKKVKGSYNQNKQGSLRQVVSKIREASPHSHLVISL